MVNPNRFYTYAYLRKDRTPYYIGKGKGRRLYNKGKGQVSQPKDKSRIIYLKQNLTEEEAFRHEIYMIAVFGRKDLGTGILHNRTNGGDGISGYSLSEEHKKKVSEARKGIPLSEKHRKKISEALKGRMHSEETKRKLSEAKKGENHPNYGKSLSEETKRKMSESHKNLIFTYEHKLNLSNSVKGRQLSEETKKKMSKANKNKKWWNDGCGNTKFAEECPGESWIIGRGKIKKSQVA